MSELWIKNRSERDLCSCEVTEAVTNKAQKKFYSLSAIHSYDIYCIHITPFSSYNGYKLNSHLTCFRFITQSVDRAMGSNPIGASDFYLEFICNCLSYITSQLQRSRLLLVVVKFIRSSCKCPIRKSMSKLAVLQNYGRY